MANATNTLRNEIAGIYVLGDETRAATTTWHVGLFTGVLDAAGTNIGTEVSGNGYSRLALSTSDLSNTDGAVQNTAILQFPQASGGSWGTIQSIGVLQHATDNAVSDLYWFEVLDSPVTVADGDFFQFNAAGITWTIS